MGRLLKNLLHMLIITTLTTIFGVLTSIGVSAIEQTFTVNNDDGVPITYKVTSDAFHEVMAVGYKDSRYGQTTEIVLPETVMHSNSMQYTVTSIEPSLFKGSDIKSVEIPASIKTIPDSAFEDCHSLESVKLQNGVEYIGNSAFKNSELTSVKIPSSVTNIGDNAFSSCSNLTKVISCSSSPATLGQEVFECNNYDNLKINIQASSMDDYSKAGWPEKSLQPFSFEQDTIEGVTIKYTVLTLDEFSKTGTLEVTDYSGSCNSNLTIPETIEYNGFNFIVTDIGYSAFSWCNLTSIKLPDSITTIGNYAFQSCHYLTSIEIPGSVKTIPYSMFGYCEKLESVKLLEGVESIGDYVFYSCISLTNIELPDTLKTIGGLTFQNCTSLRKIEIPSSLTNIGNAPFHGCFNLNLIKYNSQTPAKLNGSGLGDNLNYYLDIWIPIGTTDNYIAAGWPSKYLVEKY